MTHLVVLSGDCWAGHCTTGRSNKVWAACLALEREATSPSAPLSETTPVLFLCVYGPSGANLRQEEPRRLSLKAARERLQKKRQEKAGKGYGTVAFAPFLPAFGSPLGLPLALPTEPSAGLPSSTRPVASPTRHEERTEHTPPWRHTAALVKAITAERMTMLLADDFSGAPSNYVLTEKANGERCLVAFDGATLRAYNRKGRPMGAPPEGAQALCRLGHPFVIDGERLIREQAGHFVAFDVLEWQGEEILTRPYRTRLTRLVRGMQRAGLLHTDRLTPTLRQARENSTVAELCVLLGIRGREQTQAVMQEIQAAGGEGVILRCLDAPYAEGGCKYKFLAEVDAFVIGIREGSAQGSLILAMRRPEDGAAIEVGHVFSGLTGRDVQAVRHLLAQGRFPVFRVRFLPASTIGLTLVMPQTSMDWLRDDKAPGECGTDQLIEQLGQERAALIAAARPAIWRHQPLLLARGGA